MALKLFISDYTHRTATQQLKTLHENLTTEGAAIFSEVDLPSMFRITQRKTLDTIFAASVACFAKDEGAFKELLTACRQCKTCLGSVEEGFSWKPGQSTSGAVKAWKTARVNGAAKIGAITSARTREEQHRKACSIIAERWPMPTEQGGRTPALLKEAGALIGKKKISYNTAIKYLGQRPRAQFNYDIKMKRKKRHEQRAD